MFVATRKVPTIAAAAAARAMATKVSTKHCAPPSVGSSYLFWKPTGSLVTRHRSNSGTTITTTASFSTDASCADDYYALLGISRGFSVDMNVLKQSYRTLMARHHPDLQQHHIQAKTTTASSEDHASQITHAYQTLRKPHTRAMHLLELLGKPIIDDTAELAASAADLVGPHFLMQILEWRERIDDIPNIVERGEGAGYSGGDGGGDGGRQNELEPLLNETRHEIESILSQLDIVFDDDDIEQARRLVAQLQYWNRIEETLLEKM